MARTARPLRLDPITTTATGHRDLHAIAYDHPHTAPLAPSSDVPTSPPTSSSSEFSRQSLEKCATSPPRSRPVSRRQSSISYLPADSPRLWAPRTPIPILGSNSLKRSVSLSGVNNVKKDARAVTGPIHQRPAHEPTVLTLAEKHADLLQFIAQKESKCLDLRSQLAVHESELLELKRKWERIVNREVGRTISPTFLAPLTASSPVNASRPAVLNGLVGGVRALAAATTSPTPTLSKPPGRPPTSARRMTRQAASISVSTTTTTSISAPSPGTSPRLSQSSVSSVAQERADKAVSLEGPTVWDMGATLTSSRTQASSHRKTLRRRSRDARVPPADAPKPLTGSSTSTSPSSAKRASIGFVTPTSVPGINSLSAMGLGRANLGEAAQGWMDSVGSKLAELHRGQTFSKGQKRATVLFSDVSQSIFSALSSAPVPPPIPSLIDEDDDAECTTLGHALLPDAISLSRRPAPSKTLLPPAPGTNDDGDDEDWNW
ncbi:hypothetical protein BJV78DRAFT_1154094 [Lactifluus subvellereus]|nr:hypothetical protein BJV78DRAFT_1154094 [Lactifluus subvellereus]